MVIARKRWTWMALALILTGAAACGGSATPSPTEIAIQVYVDIVAPAFNLAKEETSILDETQLDASTQVSEALDLFNRMVAVKTSLVENLDGIDVPPELKTSHEELLAATNEFIGLIGRIVDILEAADPESTVGTDIAADAELGIQPVNAVDTKAQQACLQIQLTAGDNDVVADLGCLDVFK